MSNARDPLTILLARLEEVHGCELRQAAQEVRMHVESEVRTLSSRECQRYMGELMGHILHLVNAKARSSRLAGVMLIDEVLDIPYGASQTRYRKLSQYLHYILESCSASELELLQLAAAAVAHMARVGGTLAAPLVEKSLRAALQWMGRRGSSNEGLRQASVLILHALALGSSLVSEISGLAQNIWNLLVDSNLQIRTDAYATLKLYLQRRGLTTDGAFEKLYPDAYKRCNDPSSKPEVIHGCLLVFRVLLEVPNRMLDASRFDRVCATVLSHKDSKDVCVKGSVLDLLPLLAGYNTTRFNARYMDHSLEFITDLLSRTFTNSSLQGSSLAGKCYLALGNLAPTMKLKEPFPSERVSELVELIERGLGSSLAPIRSHALICTAMLARALGHRISRELPDMLQHMFTTGYITPSLVWSLRVLAWHAPSLRRAVQDRLYEALRQILFYGGNPNQNAQGPSSRSRAGSLSFSTTSSQTSSLTTAPGSGRMPETTHTPAVQLRPEQKFVSPADSAAVVFASPIASGSGEMVDVRLSFSSQDWHDMSAYDHKYRTDTFHPPLGTDWQRAVALKAGAGAPGDMGSVHTDVSLLDSNDTARPPVAPNVRSVIPVMMAAGVEFDARSELGQSGVGLQAEYLSLMSVGAALKRTAVVGTGARTATTTTNTNTTTSTSAKSLSTAVVSPGAGLGYHPHPPAMLPQFSHAHQLVCALSTLVTFDLGLHRVLPLIRTCVLKYLQHPNQFVRTQCMLTAAAILVAECSWGDETPPPDSEKPSVVPSVQEVVDGEVKTEGDVARGSNLPLSATPKNPLSLLTRPAEHIFRCRAASAGVVKSASAGASSENRRHSKLHLVFGTGSSEKQAGGSSSARATDKKIHAGNSAALAPSPSLGDAWLATRFLGALVPMDAPSVADLEWCLARANATHPHRLAAHAGSLLATRTALVLRKWERSEFQVRWSPLVGGVVQRVLEAAQSDTSVAVRRMALEVLGHGAFQSVLSAMVAQVLRPLSVCARDIALAVRVRAIKILASLARLKPTVCVPVLRQLMVDLLAQVRQCSHPPTQGSALCGLRAVVELAGREVVSPYAGAILNVLLPVTLQNTHRRNALLGAICMSRLALECPFIFLPVLDQVMDGFVSHIDPKMPVSKQLVAIRTLSLLCEALGQVSYPYISHPSIISSLLHITESPDASPSQTVLKYHALDLLGRLGALDPYVYSNRAGFPEALARLKARGLPAMGSQLPQHGPSDPSDQQGVSWLTLSSGSGSGWAGSGSAGAAGLGGAAGLQHLSQCEGYAPSYVHRVVGNTDFSYTRAAWGFSMKAGSYHQEHRFFQVFREIGRQQLLTAGDPLRCYPLALPALTHARKKGRIRTPRQAAGGGVTSEYYGCVCIESLVVIIRDPQLSQHHSMAVDLLMFVCQYLPCDVYLPRVIVPFLQVMQSNPALRPILFQKLGALVEAAGAQIEPYLWVLFTVMFQYWPVGTREQPPSDFTTAGHEAGVRSTAMDLTQNLSLVQSIVALVCKLASTLEGGFSKYLPGLMPLLLSRLSFYCQADSSNAGTESKQDASLGLSVSGQHQQAMRVSLLACIQTCAPHLQNFLHLVIPVLLRVIAPGQSAVTVTATSTGTLGTSPEPVVLLPVLTSGMLALAGLARTLSVSQYVSSIVHAVCECVRRVASELFAGGSVPGAGRVQPIWLGSGGVPPKAVVEQFWDATFRLLAFLAYQMRREFTRYIPTIASALHGSATNFLKSHPGARMTAHTPVSCVLAALHHTRITATTSISALLSSAAAGSPQTQGPGATLPQPTGGRRALFVSNLYPLYCDQVNVFGSNMGAACELYDAMVSLLLQGEEVGSLTHQQVMKLVTLGQVKAQMARGEREEERLRVDPGCWFDLPVGVRYQLDAVRSGASALAVDNNEPKESQGVSKQKSPDGLAIVMRFAEPSEQDTLITVSACDGLTSHEEWTQWMDRFTAGLLNVSRSVALRSCSVLAQKHTPLARALFNSAFLSCWHFLPDRAQNEVGCNLQRALSSPTIPTDLLQCVLNLVEFMDRHDMALPINPESLVAASKRCRAYSKTMYYLERWFEASSDQQVYNELIAVANDTQVPETAVGMLRRADQDPTCSMQPSWYETLHQWEVALEAYETKSLKDVSSQDTVRAMPTSGSGSTEGDTHSHSSTTQARLDSTLGRLRCLKAIGEWDRMYALASRAWRAAQGFVGVGGGQSTAGTTSSGSLPPQNNNDTHNNSSSSSNNNNTHNNSSSSSNNNNNNNNNAASLQFDSPAQAAEFLAELCPLAAAASFHCGYWDQVEEYLAAMHPHNSHTAVAQQDRIVPNGERKGWSQSSTPHVTGGSGVATKPRSAATGGDQTLRPRFSQLSIYYTLRALRLFRAGSFREALAVLGEYRTALSGEFFVLAREGYQRAYPLLVENQLIVEMEECVLWRLFEGARGSFVSQEEADSVTDHIQYVWTRRLQTCRKDVDVWRQVLSVRVLCLPPHQDVRTWLQFARICSESKRHNMATRVIRHMMSEAGVQSDAIDAQSVMAGLRSFISASQDNHGLSGRGRDTAAEVRQYLTRDVERLVSLVGRRSADDPKVLYLRVTPRHHPHVAYAYCRHVYDSPSPPRLQRDVSSLSSPRRRRSKPGGSGGGGARRRSSVLAIRELLGRSRLANVPYTKIHAVSQMARVLGFLCAGDHHNSHADSQNGVSAGAENAQGGPRNLVCVLSTCSPGKGRLLSKCFLRLGQWQLSMSGETDLLQSYTPILNCFRAATQSDPYQADVWHNWAIVNYRIVRLMGVAGEVEDPPISPTSSVPDNTPDIKTTPSVARGSLSQLRDRQQSLHRDMRLIARKRPFVLQAMRGFVNAICYAKLGKLPATAHNNTAPHHKTQTPSQSEGLAGSGVCGSSTPGSTGTRSPRGGRGRAGAGGVTVCSSGSSAFHPWQDSGLEAFGTFDDFSREERLVTGGAGAGVGGGLQDTLRLLTLIFTHAGRDNTLEEAIRTLLSCVPLSTWLDVVPQIIARIHSPLPVLKHVTAELLIQIGLQHPQALVYPLAVARKSPVPARRTAARHIMDRLRFKYSLLVDQALLVSRELIRIAILWHERWHQGLEEGYRAWFANRDAHTMWSAHLKPLHDALRSGAQTQHEVGFAQRYGRVLATAEEWVHRYFHTRMESDLSQAWDIYCRVFRSISRTLPEVKKLQLSQCTPLLFACKDLHLAVPGTYVLSGDIAPSKPSLSSAATDWLTDGPYASPAESGGSSHGGVRISHFDHRLKVIESKQRPRKLSMWGVDGQEYPFLLKGHEDLRLDKRVMQLFRLVNSLLRNDHSTCEKKLFIQGYSVIPLSPNSGLIEWLGECDTMHAVIMWYREHNDVLLNIEHRLTQIAAPDYQKCTLLQKVEVFTRAMESTDGHDIKNTLWLRAPSSEAWLQRRSTYCQSLAVMSMVGYVLGLGDRHPCNLMLERATGRIIHIDFGDCFEVAMLRDKFPEKVPFRLTRMLVQGMEVCGIDGLYRHTSEAVMSVLRHNRESVIAVLEAFVYDPLISWKLLQTDGDQQDDLNGDARVPTDGEGKLDEAGEGAEGKAEEEDGVLGGASVGGENALSGRLSGNTAGLSGAAGGSSRGTPDNNASTVQQQPTDMAGDSELVSQQALGILKRIHDKLTGRDFVPDACGRLVSTLAIEIAERRARGGQEQGSEDRISVATLRGAGDAGIEVSQQCDALIRQATAAINLAPSYLGWCAHW